MRSEVFGWSRRLISGVGWSFGLGVEFGIYVIEEARGRYSYLTSKVSTVLPLWDFSNQYKLIFTHLSAPQCRVC